MMANLGWSFVQRVTSSSVSWIATKPLLVLTLILLLIFSTNAASGWYVYKKMSEDMINQLKMQASAYEKKYQEREQEFQKTLEPIMKERDELKKRLVKFKPAKPPANATELVKRFRALGY